MPRELLQKQTARRAQFLSGMSYLRALEMARAGILTPRRPVPDATGSPQREFEAAILHALVDAFPDRRQVPALFLGIASVRPRPRDLSLHLHAETAPAVLAALLPRYDREYGGIIGVPGLRLTAQGKGWWRAFSVTDPASTDVRIPASEKVLGAAQRLIADEHGGARPEERRQLTREEREEIEFRRRLPATHERNLLLSRVIRRIRLIDLVGHSHGLVNIYHHHYGDIVFEWCCGPDAPWVARQLTDTGLLGDARSAARLDDPGLPSQVLELGSEAAVVLRRNLALHGAYEEFGKICEAFPTRDLRWGRR